MERRLRRRSCPRLRSSSVRSRARWEPKPVFEWQPVAEAASYKVELARDADFLVELSSQTVNATTLSWPEALPKGKWFWRVSGIDSKGFPKARRRRSTPSRWGNDQPPRRRRRAVVSSAIAGAAWLWRDEAALVATTRFPALGFRSRRCCCESARCCSRQSRSIACARSSRDSRQQRSRASTPSKIESISTRRERPGRFAPSRAGVIVGGLIVPIFTWTSIDAYLETRALDLFFRLRFPERSQAELATGRATPSAVKQEDVVVLAIDDDTITRLGWPMPRFNYARLIDVVSAAKPASLTFDVSLVDPLPRSPRVGHGCRRGRTTRRQRRLQLHHRPPDGRDAARDVGGRAQGARCELDSLARVGCGLPEYTEIVGGDAAPNPVIPFRRPRPSRSRWPTWCSMEPMSNT